MRLNMVTIREFSHVVDLLDRFAAPEIVDGALLSAGLDRSVLKEKAGFAPYAAEGVVVEAVARSIGDRHLGARVGHAFDYSTYGAYATYVLGAPDLGTALERGRRALVLTHPGSSITFRQTGSHLVVGRDSRGLTITGHRHLDEGTVFVIGAVARHFLGAGWVPDWVEVPDEPRNCIETLERLVGAPVHVRAGPPGIAIRLSELPTLNPDVSHRQDKITLQDLAGLMGVSPVQTVADVVEHILRITFAHGDVSEVSVARHLAIGPRTLQRALRREGTSFREVRAGFAEKSARHLVARTGRSLEEISSMLGYKHPRSFRRAFKGWTGVSPSGYRANPPGA
ncbi:AraC family transcriptional regulator ligand-binding domain-containing protein [Shimia sp. W99]